VFALAPSCPAPTRRTAHLLHEALALLLVVSVRSKVALAFTVGGELLPVPRSVRRRVYLPAPRLQDCRRKLMASMTELERRYPVADEKWIRVHRTARPSPAARCRWRIKAPPVLRALPPPREVHYPPRTRGHSSLFVPALSPPIQVITETRGILQAGQASGE